MASITRSNPGAPAQLGGGFERWLQLRDLMRWDPFQELSRIAAEQSKPFVPDFDVRETDRGYVFTADLPGIGEDQIEVSISGNRVTISGTRDPEEELPSDTAYLAERAYGAFTRTFTLPGDIDLDRVQAGLRDGVLRLNVAKAVAAEPRRIPVASEAKDAEAQKTGGESEELIEPP